MVNEQKVFFMNHCAVICAICAICGLSISSAPAAEPVMNPRKTLKVVETTTLWKAPVAEVGEGKKKRKRALLGARQARFNPDGTQLAWSINGSVEGGGLFVAHVATGKVATLWKAPPGASVERLAWSPRGDLAACVRVTDGEKVARFVVRSAGGKHEATRLPGTSGAFRLAWSDDGKTLAFSTKTTLLTYNLKALKAEKLLDVPAAKAPPRGPAFEDLMFYKNAVAARRVGTMRYTLVFADKKTVDLGECRGIAPDPARNRLYLVPWLAGPVKIPRGAGVAWIDPEAEKPTRKTIVPDRPARDSAKPYWLIDVWDWHYPTTLRVSADGKTVTFAGVKAGVLAKNAWREFCIWRAPTNGSKPPEALASAGSMPKRLDVGDSHCVAWRYSIENASLFFDLAGGRAWRLPKGFYVQRANTDALPGQLLIGAARGRDVTLFKLEEVKR
jgi:WD40-like Beta Propeller Repeat